MDHKEIPIVAEAEKATGISQNGSQTLDIKTIFDFVETLDRSTDSLHMIDEAGLSGDYDLNVEWKIWKSQELGLMLMSVLQTTSLFHYTT